MADRGFVWDSPEFDSINKITLNFSRQIVDLGLIEDVYLDGEFVIIKHKVNCKGGNFVKDIQNSAKEGSNQVSITFKFPLAFPVSNQSVCNEKEKNGCTFYGCPLLCAAYLYHREVNLKQPRKQIEVKKELKLESNENKFNRIEPVNFRNEFTIEELEKYKTLISKITNDELVPQVAKNNFIRLIKTLSNYNALKETTKQIKPLTNYSFIENTDTVNKLCIGQEKCIELLSEILMEFGMIKSKEIKYVNFKELTEKDELISDNYKEEIIVLYNIYAISEGLVDPNAKKQRIIKQDFPSYIMNNSDKKVFIVCDKKVNIKGFYSKIPQLKLQFETILIPDLKIDDVFNILMNMFQNKNLGLSTDTEFNENFHLYLEENYPYAPYKNLEFVNFLYQNTIKNTLITNHPNEIHLSDLFVFRTNSQEEFESLDNLVGLNNVKSEIQNLKTTLEFTNQKLAIGEEMPKFDMHMVYYGNPGTGKTTVARLMAGILFNLGYIRYNKCIEVEAKDMIANIPGQTAIQTSSKIQEALGGILFVDEAYALGESEYGKECIAALIKSMEDYRDDLIVILAGYKVEMSRFLKINSGFESRVAFYFDFKDYTNEELIQMTDDLLKKYDFRVENYSVTNKFNDIYERARKKGQGFGNSRFVRNTVNEVLRKHAVNTAFEEDNDLKNHIITLKDLPLF